MIKIKAAEAAKNLDTHGTPTASASGADAMPVPLALARPEAWPQPMQRSNPPHVSNKFITMDNLMAALPRKMLNG